MQRAQNFHRDTEISNPYSATHSSSNLIPIVLSEAEHVIKAPYRLKDRKDSTDHRTKVSRNLQSVHTKHSPCVEILPLSMGCECS